MQSSLQRTKNLLDSRKIRPRKSFGQHFLVQDNIADRIISESRLSEEDIVVEVGAGLGVLTERIVGKVSKVFAVELDRYLSAYLIEKFNDKDNVAVIEKNILDLELDQISDSKVKIIANIPYRITSDIITYFLDNRKFISSVIIMVQKEVAERITAKPGSKIYGSFSVFVQFYSQPKILFNVSKNSFYPKPKVDSSVLKLDILESPSAAVKSEELFFKVVRSAFGKRRKIILNSLYKSKLGSDYSKEEIARILENAGIDPMIRAERLSIMEFSKLSDLFIKD